MPIIHLVGPNAIGKTTTVKRWGARYSSLKVASLDLLRKEAPDKQAKRDYLLKNFGDQDLVAESAYTSQLVVVSCDQGGNGAVLVNGDWVADPGWKGDQTEKEGKVRSLPQRAKIAVCESARTTTTTTFALPEEPIIIVTCSGHLLGKHLRARCEAKGKRFREDYWNGDKLQYEASRRYLNFAAKNLLPSQVKHFEIKDQATDWPAVDIYFAALFRRLHNAIVRSRS